MNDLGNVLGEQGDLAGSIKMLEGSLATFREVGDKHSAAAVLSSMAARTLQQGNLQKAKQMLEEAARLAVSLTESAQKPRLGHTSINRREISH